MFYFIPYIKQEEQKLYLKNVNMKIKKNKELEYDICRFHKIKEHMDKIIKTPIISYNTGIYYSYLLKEYNELKNKLDIQQQQQQSISILEETKEGKTDDLSISKNTSWYDTISNFFNYFLNLDIYK